LSDTIQDLGGSARLVSRSLSVRVEGYARATSNLDDTLDTISAEVETAVANSTSIDALLTDLELSSTEVSFTEGDREIGVITMDFGVIYTVASNDPQTAK
jgi:ABC-type transporter Mla subunit MlaD